MDVRPWAALIGLAVSGAFAAGVPGADAGGSAQIDSPTLSIRHAGLVARATTGSFCSIPPAGAGATPGICADSAYPLRVRGRLPVRPGGRAILRFSVEPDAVVAHLVRVDGRDFEVLGRKLAVRRLSARRWAVRLRRDLAGANVLDVSIRWRNPRDGQGDANFWGGIRRVCG
jgi:hypothetical protein